MGTKVKLVCEACGGGYERTPSTAWYSRFCSWPCKNKICSEERRRPLEERFWEKVHRGGPDDCWPWSGASTRGGYGAINVNGKVLRAPRVAYELAHGSIPAHLHVRHACDNPPCVNPSHLSLGKPADNTADKVARGRAARNTKLSDAQVQRIREARAPLIDLAARYNVSVGLISLIRGKAGHRVKHPVTMSVRRERALAKRKSRPSPTSPARA